MSFIDNILCAPINGGFSMDDYWVWCGSAIPGEDGKYHLFSARWPKKYPFFLGYIHYSEIVRAESATPEGPYEFREVVLGDIGEEHWDGRMTHNPTIRKCGDDYVLFYIGGTFKGEKPAASQLRKGKVPETDICYNSIRIGAAISKSVLGPWKRPDKPILEPRAGKWDSRVVTNPAPCILENGKIYLYYRSNTPEGLRIGLAAADNINSPFIRVHDDPVIQFENGGYVEDPFVWHNGRCFEMIAKDWTGLITGEKNAGMHARSGDGISWTLADPVKAYSRTVKWDNGATTVQGHFERPQLILENGIPTHLLAATMDGHAEYFDDATRSWNMVIPLKK